MGYISLLSLNFLKQSFFWDPEYSSLLSGIPINMLLATIERVKIFTGSLSLYIYIFIVFTHLLFEHAAVTMYFK